MNPPLGGHYPEAVRMVRGVGSTSPSFSIWRGTGPAPI